MTENEQPRAPYGLFDFSVADGVPRAECLARDVRSRFIGLTRKLRYVQKLPLKVSRS